MKKNLNDWESFVKSSSDLELVHLRFRLKKTQPDDKKHLKIVEDELKRRLHERDTI